MRNSFRKGRFFVPAILALSASFFFTACGKEKTEETISTGSSEESLSEYTYAAEYSDVSLQEAYQFKVVGDKIYAISSVESSSVNLSISNLVGYDMAGGGELFRSDLSSVAETPELGEEDYLSLGVMGFDVAEDGSVKCAAGYYLYHAADESNVSSAKLVSLDPNGQITQSVELDDVLGTDEYIQDIIIREDGSTIIMTSNVLYLFDENDQPAGKITIGEDKWINGSLEYNGNFYLLMYDDQWNSVAYEVNFETGALKESSLKLGNNVNNYFHGLNNSILEAGSTGLVRRNPEDGSSEEILKWTDCDIISDYVQSVIENEDGTFNLILRNWSNNKVEIAKLSRILRSELGERVELSLGCFYNDQSMTNVVVAFNKSQSKIHVTPKVFFDDESDMSYEDAQAAYLNGLTGSNPPDIIMLSYGDDELFGDKDIFEDLTPFLEKSTRVPLSDYEPYVLDLYNHGGVQYGIPYTLSLTTIVANSDVIGQREGWTLDEFLTIAEAHPDTDMFEYMQRDYLAQYLLGFAMDGFVDWENGKCNFVNDSFKRLLNFLKSQPEEIIWDDSDTRSVAGKIADGDVLMLQSYIDAPEECQVNDAIMGGKAVYVGYPTLDGSQTSQLTPSGGYAMNKQSSHKEEVWEFIEFAATMDPSDNAFVYGIPASKSGLDRMLKNYIDGTRQIEGNGVGWGNDFNYTYHNVTADEINLFKQLLSTGKCRSDRNTEIFEIINEEAGAFYAGQKSADEVANIIQSRVSLYVSEHK